MDSQEFCSTRSNPHCWFVRIVFMIVFMIGDHWIVMESACNAAGRTGMTHRQFTSTDEGSEGHGLGNRCGYSVAGVFVVVCIVMILVALFLPAPRRARHAARRSQCKNNLKQIGLALHNYADVHGSLPPAFTVDEEGLPLHSWRTLILPYLDQQALYKTIDLSKPWDDPVNAAVRDTEIAVYTCPSGGTPRTHTTYMAIVGSDACFSATEPRGFSDITDGTSETLALIEVSPDDAVHWMSPMDSGRRFALTFEAEITLGHTGGVHCLRVDGSAGFLSPGISDATRRALITIAGDDKAEGW